MADAIITTTTTTNTKATTQQTPNRFSNIVKTTTTFSSPSSSTSTSPLANAANRDTIATPINNNTSGCTKIAVMQLFHEMKQEFATVPDYIVGQHVNANCNNRSALLAALKNESYRFPGSVQAYPQALRQQHQSTDEKSSNETPIDTSNNAHFASTESLPTKSAASDANHSPSAAATKPPHHPSSPSSSSLGRRPRVKISQKWPHHQSTPMLGNSTGPTDDNSEPIASASTTIKALNLSSRLNSEYSNEDTTQRDITNNQPHRTIQKSTEQPQSNNTVQTKPKVPQRPSTLNLVSQNASTSAFQPNRPAPVVPPRPSYLLNNNNNNNNQNKNTNSSHPTEVPINVSVNVTVSPITTSPSSCSTTVRHTSALNVQPELPWPFFQTAQPPQSIPTTNSAVPPIRSFTSVQFKLRPPMDGNSNSGSQPDPSTPTTSNSPHQQPSPIDISAGPTQLTYSSASFDARKGLQSHFQITVDGGGNGSFSATRTRPRYTMPPVNENSVTTTPSAQPHMLQGAIAAAAAAAARTRRMSPGSSVDNGEIRNDDVVSRQNLRKTRLLVELDNERKRLTLMQEEINTLQAPIPPGGSGQLAEDIRQLQNSCKQMVQLVENAGPYVLGETNEAFYQQIQSSQSLLYSPHSARPTPQQSLGSASSSTSNPITPPSASTTSLASSPSPYYINHQQPQPQQQPQQPPLSPPEAQPWSCYMCTFQNHPLLNKCEQCEMPLMTTSGTNTTQTAPYASLAPSHGPALASSASFALPTRPAPPPPRPLQRNTGGGSMSHLVARSTAHDPR